MRYRVDEPLFTSVIEEVASFRPRQGALYVTGVSVEERSRHLAAWEASCTNVTFASLVSHDSSAATFDVGGALFDVRLRSNRDVAGIWAQKPYRAAYLDITGLPHRVWAPLLRGMRSGGLPAYCVYVEPKEYRRSDTPTEGNIYDLSESIEGISPLPGFVSLGASREEEAVFVPLLGFEGARFAFMLEEVQPDRTQIYPIVGVPGFRYSYPFDTYFGNRAQLAETSSWQNVRFAAANCPFSLYHLLAELGQESEHRYLKIAPIGTKPHALGAILYSLDHPSTTEVLYDHPVRRAMRTSGAARVCLYDLSLLPPLRAERSR